MAPKRRRSVGSVAAEGDQLATLRALRDRLGAELDLGPHPREVAALTARLTDVLDRIAALEKAAAAPDEGATPLAQVLAIVKSKPSAGTA